MQLRSTGFVINIGLPGEARIALQDTIRRVTFVLTNFSFSNTIETYGVLLKTD